MYFTSTESEEQMLFDIVLSELRKRALEGRYEGSMPNYNDLEDARVYAVATGAMRTDNYFNN